MRAVSVKCPNCGALLNVSEAATTVACEYCHTTSQIRRRTMFLERQEQMPARSAGLSVAVQRHTGRWFMTLALVPMLLGVAVVGAIAYRRGAFGGGGRIWHQLGPIQAMDVNGDGFVDPIGFAMHPFASDENTTLLAVSGKDGSVLWESKSLGAFSEVASSNIVATKTALFVARDAGRLRGFDSKTGNATWSTQLAEKPKTFCAGEDSGHVVIETADGAWITLDMATGTTSPAIPTQGCPRIAGGTIGSPSRQSKTISNFDEIESAATMNVEEVVHHIGSDVAIGFGVRLQGTRVPMVGVYRLADGAEVWSAEVPASDPLSADTGAPTGKVTKDHIALVYEQGDDARRITVFRIADGQRLWDREVPGHWGVTGLAIVNNSVLASSAGLYSFDLDTGALQFSAAVTPNR